MPSEARHNEAAFDDMLQETRVLLAGAQVLTAFLIVIPFSATFSDLVIQEKWAYVATFVCSLTSLVFFSSPAVHHRLMWPVRAREDFKAFETRMLVIGLVPLSLAWILATHLVMFMVLGEPWSWWVTALMAGLLFSMWWVLPWVWGRRRENQS